MKKYLLIIPVVLICSVGYSQSHRISINSSNIYFNDFSQRKVVFNGISSELSILIYRISFDIGVTYCFPKTYYGLAKYYAFTDYSDKEIWVYAKGGTFSMWYGGSFEFYKSRSDKISLSSNISILLFTHNGYYDEENFIRIYGGYDNININNFLFGYGLRCVYKLGYIPLFFKVTGNIPLGKQEYNNFKTSSYYQFDAGIALPVIKSPSPDKINKITY